MALQDTAQKTKKGAKSKPKPVRRPEQKPDGDSGHPNEMAEAQAIPGSDMPVDASPNESQPGVLRSGDAGQTPNPGVSPPTLSNTLTHSDIFGQIMQLMMRSPAHRHLFLADMEWLVLPPLALRQCRVVGKKGENGVAAPVAYISWAWLSEETEQRISASGMGGIRLQGNEWNAKLRGDGDARPWIIDVIAPFGGADKLIEEVKKNVFGGGTVKALRPAPSGGGMAVVEW